MPNACRLGIETVLTMAKIVLQYWKCKKKSSMKKWWKFIWKQIYDRINEKIYECHDEISKATKTRFQKFCESEI